MKSSAPPVHAVPRANLVSSPSPIDPPMHILNVHAASITDLRLPVLNVIVRATLMTLFLDVSAAPANIRVRVLVDPGADICLVSRRLCYLAGLAIHSTGV